MKTPELERMSPYERDQNRKHIIVECICWFVLVSGLLFLAISFFGAE
jgi:hypothetical protein